MDNYCWTDGKGKHHFVYAKTLEELRDKKPVLAIDAFPSATV